MPTPTLPFAIKAFNIANYHGIKQTQVEDLPLTARWIFLTGENGYGKTSVLQAIAIGLYGRRAIIDPPINTNTRVLLTFAKNGTITTRKQDSKAKFIAEMLTYGASRLQLQASETQEEVGRKSTAIYGLFHSDGLMLNIERELVLWSLENNPRFAAVRQLLLNVIPYLSDIIVEDRKVKYIEQSLDNQNYEPVNFEQLASGFRNIVGFIGDMIIKFYKSQPNIINPADFKGIVIIDELDLHLHPKMQCELVEKLTTIFPKIQFIASTHSPIPFLGIPQDIEVVFLKVDRTIEEGITVERLEIDFQNMTPNLILSSPLFGFSDIIPNSNHHLNQLHTQDTYPQMLREQDIDQCLAIFAANNDLNLLFNPPTQQ